jgi:hypothetical protein
MGSGVHVGDGRVVTALHILTWRDESGGVHHEQVPLVYVQGRGWVKGYAMAVHSDAFEDLAIIQIGAAGDGLIAAPFTKTELKAGEETLALGCQPYDERKMFRFESTEGTATGREDWPATNHIWPGWSGGGLFVKRDGGYELAGILLGKPMPYVETKEYEFEPVPGAVKKVQVDTIHDHPGVRITRAQSVRCFLDRHKLKKLP